MTPKKKKKTKKKKRPKRRHILYIHIIQRQSNILLCRSGYFIIYTAAKLYATVLRKLRVVHTIQFRYIHNNMPGRGSVKICLP